MKNIEIIFTENPKKESIKIFTDFDIWMQQGSMIITSKSTPNKKENSYHISSVKIKNINTKNIFDCINFSGFYKDGPKGYFPVEIKIKLDIHK